MLDHPSLDRALCMSVLVSSGILLLVHRINPPVTQPHLVLSPPQLAPSPQPSSDPRYRLHCCAAAAAAAAFGQCDRCPSGTLGVGGARPTGRAARVGVPAAVAQDCGRLHGRRVERAAVHRDPQPLRVFLRG